MTDLLEAALSYAQLGWCVFPCNGKKPATEHGLKDATADPEQIKSWWQNRNYNIAVVCGQPSGFWALDIDTYGEISLEDLGIELPETIEQETARGRHVLFKTSGLAIKSTAGKLGKDLDVRGDGGYIIVAPSVHPDTGKTYCWEVDHRPDNFNLAEAPEALLRLVEKQDTPQRTNGTTQPHLQQHDTSYGLKALAGESEKVVTAPIGQQENTLNTAAFKIGQLIADGDVALATAVKALTEAGLEMANDPAREAWTEKQIHEKVVRGLREGAGKLREPHSGDKLREEPEAEAKEEHPEEPFQMSAVREHEPGEVNWIVEDVLPEGFTLLAGRPKMGKSFLILDIAVNVANGRQVAKAFPTEQTGVLYLALEDNLNRIIRRLDAVGVAREDYPTNCTVATQWPAGPVGVAKIDAFLSEHPDHKVVLIDTLQHILKPDTEEGYRVTSAELRPLQRLALKHGAAIVAVLHTRKSKAIKDDEFDPLDFDNILGSRAYSAVADAIIMMHRARNEKFGRLAITGRDVSDAIYEASFDKQRWEFAAVNRRTTIRKQVIELFEQHCEAEYSPLEVCQRLGLDTAKHHDAMRQRLSRMEKEGAIERVSHGRYKQRDISIVT